MCGIVKLLELTVYPRCGVSEGGVFVGICGKKDGDCGE
jgi:hypothetical protein